MIKGCSHGYRSESGALGMNMVACTHGEPFVCLTDVVYWMNKLEYHDEVQEDVRDFFVRELTIMALAYSSNLDVKDG